MADCSGVRTTGHWKGHRCGSPGLHIFDGKWWCANHFPINDSIEQIAYLKRQLSEANKKLDERDRAVAKETARKIAAELKAENYPRNHEWGMVDHEDLTGLRYFSEAKFYKELAAWIEREFGLEG